MNMASVAEVRIDRLEDDTYVLTKQDPATYKDISQSCPTEGSLVGALLRAIMPHDGSHNWDRAQDMAAVATVSLDKALEDWDDEHRVRLS